MVKPLIPIWTMCSSASWGLLHSSCSPLGGQMTALGMLPGPTDSGRLHLLSGACTCTDLLVLATARRSPNLVNMMQIYHVLLSVQLDELHMG